MNKRISDFRDPFESRPICTRNKLFAYETVDNMGQWDVQGLLLGEMYLRKLTNNPLKRGPLKNEFAQFASWERFFFGFKFYPKQAFD